MLQLFELILAHLGNGLILNHTATSSQFDGFDHHGVGGGVSAGALAHYAG